MFYNTTSGKDISWEVKIKNIKTTRYVDTPINTNLLIDHRTYFDNIIKKYNL